MARFFGKDDRSLDVKGRVILPARFRTSFAGSVFVTPHYERCLALWTPDEFDKIFQEMQDTQSLSTEARNFARVWAATSSEERMDGQGRLSIPANLREFARLQPDSPVLVIGSLDRIELWNPTDWQARVAPAEAMLDNPDLSRHMSTRTAAPTGE